MRRRFDQSILVTKPPAPLEIKRKTNFNYWFCNTLKKCNISNVEFSILSGIPYSTVMGWRKKNNPQFWRYRKIASAFCSLGLGSYQNIFNEIDKLCQ